MFKRWYDEYEYTLLKNQVVTEVCAAQLGYDPTVDPAARGTRTLRTRQRRHRSAVTVAVRLAAAVHDT